ncbi:C-terminal helicase domain-containing protein [Kordiimonas sp.]|uniref:C-terminal helicase domain-containing protein n=1 Tax=Kordiimonas sp. TaxID=1970157 RepID=UPI003A9175F1
MEKLRASYNEKEGTQVTYIADEHLALLKPFQKATVEYVFRRLFTDPSPTDQFLVADEVGLGKTMVARGVIAKTIEQLQGKVDRVDIVYICSNQAIAEQNIKSLNVVGSATKPLNTRLTLLPLEIEKEGGIASRPINLISLTPGTALDLKSSLGTAPERALIFEMLRARIGLRHRGIQRVFRGGVSEENWRGWTTWIRGERISQDIADKFNRVVDDKFIERLREAADLARRHKHPTYPDDQRPAAMIGELRRMLAKICVDALTPDLIILDEFQRFAELLHDHDDEVAPEKAAAAELARALFSYNGGDGSKARLLLLSATPYRMLTLSSDAPEEGEHYDDFLRTMRFLFGNVEGPARVRELKSELAKFRRSLQSMPSARAIAIEQRDRLHGILSRVIARTERVDSTEDRNSLVQEVIPEIAIDTDDLREAKAVARVAELVGAPSIIEYWKSAPYLLNFMRGYKLRDRLQALKPNPAAALRKAIREASPHFISKKQIEDYAELPFRNGRMRALADLAFNEALDRSLWIPPSRPSFGMPKSGTKALVFSDWSMVPDAIAALLSHEASRRMGMSPDLVSRTSRPIGVDELMPMLYPSPSLAALVDPLVLERRFGRAESYEILHAQACMALREQLAVDAIAELAQSNDRVLALALDRTLGREVRWSRVGVVDHDGHDEHGAMARTIATLREALQADERQGEIDPDTVVEKLASLALGSPAICALRALSRLCPELAVDDPELISASIGIALGFRSLYNQPETRALLAETSPLNYWRDIIKHAAQSDLPAVLDEYLQLVLETERAEKLAPKDRAKVIASSVIAVVALRPAQITLDHWSTKAGRLYEQTFEVRARFAMRFATKAEEEKGVRRTSAVQAAFKSPFRPFVLASTSIGQEGLDFHPYCSRIVHWNLPRNPVDIEQREGRVHRYKNHAVRRNVATAFSTTPLTAQTNQSPWVSIFEAAQDYELSNGRPGDIIPYWVYPGDHKIERIVLIPPFSREKERYKDLIKSLATYRLAFGQPRQDELISLFLGMDEFVQDLSELQISLKPG